MGLTVVVYSSLVSEDFGKKKVDCGAARDEEEMNTTEKVDGCKCRGLM